MPSGDYPAEAGAIPHLREPRRETQKPLEKQKFMRVGPLGPADLITCIDVRTVTRVLPVVVAAASVAVLLQGGASQAQTVRVQPTLSSLVAEAKQLSNQVDSLGQQYDGLKIEVAHAKSEEYFAKQAAKQADEAMAGSRAAVAQLAAMGYMNGGMNPTLQLLTSGDPGQFLNQASTVEEVDNEAGLRLSTLQREQLAASRAQEAAEQEIATVDTLTKQINGKVSQINAKMQVLNSSEMSAALTVFNKTGNYPNFPSPSGNTVGVIALRAALTRRGYPYVWGAAGPTAFDCSGLVVWAFAQEGISLPHYTGDLWNLGVHVSEADLEPGDLVFFFEDESHVGIYIGDGLMVDAPTQGQDVQVQAIDEDPYDGAVRIS
jgi:peptidoglycan DL-endopeptidase CwlO